MWEITLVGKYCDYPFFIELQKEILQKKIDALVSIGFGENLSISIGAKYDLLSKIEDLLLETIIKINKREFLITHLNCLGKGRYNEFVVSCLVYLDLAEELHLAKYYAKFEKINHIREFLRFKLPNIYSAWMGEITAINYIFDGKDDECFYLDFLKYLVNVTSSNYSIVYLQDNIKNLVLVDEKNGKTKCVVGKDDIDILVNLVIYSPQKIVIKSQNYNDKIYNVIRYIFDDKVSFVL